MIHNWSYNHEYHIILCLAPRGIINFKHVWGVLYERRGGGGGGSFELAKMVVSVLHKWLQCKVKKLK